MGAIPESFFSAEGRQVWWGATNIINKPGLSAKEAVKESGTDWEVRKCPIYAKVSEDATFKKCGLIIESPPPGKTEVSKIVHCKRPRGHTKSCSPFVQNGDGWPGQLTPNTSGDKFALVRMDTLEILDTVGSMYTPRQNLWMAEYIETLLDVGKALFVTGGVLRIPGKTGIVVWYCAKLPKTMKVGNLKGEDLDIYVNGILHHGDGRANEIHASMIRPCCENTLMGAIKNAISRFVFKHLPNVEERVAEVKESLKISYDYADAFTQELGWMLDQEAKKDTLQATVEAIWPKPNDDATDRSKSSWDSRFQDIVTVWKESPNLQDVKTTRYGVYNAITEWSQWGRNIRGSSGDSQKNATLQLESTLFGENARIGDRAFQFLRYELPESSKVLAVIEKPKKMTKEEARAQILGPSVKKFRFHKKSEPPVPVKKKIVRAK